MEHELPGSDELYDVLDEQGKVVGTATRARVHSDPELIHRAVHVWLWRSDARLLLQKRVRQKDVEPGKWDTSVGGHVDAGEDYLTAALREMKEELGVEGVPLEHVHDFKYRSDSESENVRTYQCFYDGPVRPHEFEIEKVREWTALEIGRAIGKGILTANFEEEWNLYKCRTEEKNRT